MPDAPPSVEQLLDLAVQALGGSPRAGQREMAVAVADAMREREHLLVQAGTGTGKSLGYLVPAAQHAHRTGRPVVVATATLALQGQIVDRDLPRLADALTPALGRRLRYALVKGRRNYVCRYRIDGGMPSDDEQLPGFAEPAPASRLGDEVLRLRAWATATTSGDRDELVPGVSERAWRQVSVSGTECLGSRCPMVTDCFAESARAQASDVDIVVTNHALLAIDALEGRNLLPEHDVLVVDEGHELVDRITSAITADLGPGTVTAAGRLSGRFSDHAEAVEESATLFAGVLDPLSEGRLMALPDALELALTRIRDATRLVQSDLTAASDPGSAEGNGARQMARAAVDEVHDVAVRLLREREVDVVWLTRDAIRGPVLRVAPLTVAGLLRERVFGVHSVVLTSATLTLGGSFQAVAGSLGLAGEQAPSWRGLDVGSPFDYQRQAIAYVARHLPAPGRDGPSEASLDELESLVRAAGGRTLGLFSSMRAAQRASEELRERFAASDAGIEVLCQGEDQLPTLVRRFAAEARTCLFGTLSLWQGVDVPGSSLQLVVIDRIPFPRPDDPLSSARTQAVARAGGNGFMAVSAGHAALRLAQGSGRLVRRGTDRGIVAFLDPRLVTARYAGFLQRSLPPFWPTTDRDLVLAALRRLDETAGEPEPVAEPPTRSSGVTGAVGTAPSRPVAAGSPPAPGGPRTAVVRGHAWTPEQDAELRDAADAGIPPEDLVEHFGMPADVLAARAGQLGLALALPAEPGRDGDSDA